MKTKCKNAQQTGPLIILQSGPFLFSTRNKGHRHNLSLRNIILSVYIKDLRQLGANKHYCEILPHQAAMQIKLASRVRTATL